MAEFLVIRIAADADAPVSWIAVDSSGARRSAPDTGSLSDAAADIGEQKVIVLVPSTEVLTTSADIPIKGGARLQAALPYALEEFLADDVDKLHFAAGARRSSGRVPISVVSREKLAEWLSRLSAAGIKPAQMIAENYGLARIPGTISLLVAENQIIINDGADIELVMQDLSPGDALAAIGALDDNRDDDNRDTADAVKAASTSAMPRHVLVYCEPGDDERYQHDWIAIRHELESVDVNLLPDGAMPRLAVTVATGAGINLLQGDFADKTEYASLLRPWKHAAMLLLGLIAVGIAANAANLYALKKQEAEFRGQFHVEFRKISPTASDVQDPAAVVASLRARTGGATDVQQVFLQSLAHLSRALEANSEAHIETISYRNGVVDIRLTAPNVATLDNIQRSIAESGQFSASIEYADQKGETVDSRMQIQASGA